MKEFLLGMTALAILIVAEIIDTFSLQDIVLPMVWAAVKGVSILLIGIVTLVFLLHLMPTNAVEDIVGAAENIFAIGLLLGMAIFIVVYFVQEIRKRAKRRAEQRGESNNSA